LTTGAGTSNTASPRPIDLLVEMVGDLFPDEGFADFRARVAAIGAELAARPPFLFDAWFEFIRHMTRRPKRFLELHGAQGLNAADLRRLEPRLGSRREAYILLAGALLIWMDLPSMRVGKLMPGGRCFGVGHELLKKITGMSARRIRRAMADLVAAGYVTSTQPIARYIKPDSTVGHAAWNAIYRFEVKFFQRLHRDKKLAAQRRRLSERRAQRRDRAYAASLLRARQMHQRAQQNLRARSIELLGEPTRGEPYRRRRRDRPPP
jgi:hypothetical protein